MTMFWLKTILAEVDNVTDTEVDSVEPKNEPGPKDHVVTKGLDLDQDLRRLFFLWGQYEKRADEQCEKIRALKEAVTEEEYLKYFLLKEQATLLAGVFTSSCRIAYPALLDKSSIGVRKGWQVVWTDTAVTADEMYQMIVQGAFGDMLRSGINESSSDVPPKKSQMH